MYVRTRRQAHAHTYTDKYNTHALAHSTRASAHTHTYWQGRLALNVGHWALLSLKRAETVPKPPLQSDRFRTPDKNTVAAAAAPANDRRRGQVFKSAQKPLPSRITDRSRRVLLACTLHRGGGGREGWGEKQEAYFTLRCTVMRNRDSRAHYFANSRSAKRRGLLCNPRRGSDAFYWSVPNRTQLHLGKVI